MIARAVPLHWTITANFCASAHRTWETHTMEHGVSKRWLAARHMHTARAACLRLRHCVVQSNATKITIHHRKNLHWLSTETLHLACRKRLAYKLAKCTDNPCHYQEYRVISNQVNSHTRKNRTQHLNQITANLSQDHWRWLKTLDTSSPDPQHPLWQRWDSTNNTL